MPIKINSAAFRETSYNFLGRDNGDLEWIPRYGLECTDAARSVYAFGPMNLPERMNSRSSHEQLE